MPPKAGTKKINVPAVTAIISAVGAALLVLIQTVLPTVNRYIDMRERIEMAKYGTLIKESSVTINSNYTTTRSPVIDASENTNTNTSSPFIITQPLIGEDN